MTAALRNVAPWPRVRAVALALWLGAIAQSAGAALFDDDEARKRIVQTNERIDKLQRDLETRITAVEQQLKSAGLVDLFNHVEALKADIARLRGQVEVLTHELTEAQKRQRDLYVDLDSRMRKLEGTPSGAPTAAVGAAAGATEPAPVAGSLPPATAPAPASASAAVAPVTAAEQRSYDAALDQFKRGDYPGAIAGFGAFVKANPRNLLAPSAQYWIGNAQFARKDYRGAIAAQRQLIQTWPDSNKIPDALLNIASAQSELTDNAAARRTLEELIAKYPQSEAAAKAKQRLGQR